MVIFPRAIFDSNLIFHHFTSSDQCLSFIDAVSNVDQHSHSPAIHSSARPTSDPPTHPRSTREDVTVIRNYYVIPTDRDFRILHVVYQPFHNTNHAVSI